MKAATSNFVERKGGRVKVEIAVFIGELLGAESKCVGNPFGLSCRCRVLYEIELCQEHFLGVILAGRRKPVG
jgi:hypothetical protein